MAVWALGPPRTALPPAAVTRPAVAVRLTQNVQQLGDKPLPHVRTHVDLIITLVKDVLHHCVRGVGDALQRPTDALGIVHCLGKHGGPHVQARHLEHTTGVRLRESIIQRGLDFKSMQRFYRERPSS